MGLFKKEEKLCPLCGEKTGFGNALFNLNSGDFICTKCVILLAGILKKDQEKLTNKTLKELRTMRQHELNIKEASETTKQLIADSYNPTTSIGTILMLDEKNRLFSEVSSKPKNIYSLDSVIGYELVENGASITSGGLGRAAIGGLLFGGTGAVIGAVTGKKKTTNLISDLKIKLTTNNLKTPVIYINLIDKPISSDSSEYRGRIEAADEVLSSLDILLK